MKRKLIAMFIVCFAIALSAQGQEKALKQYGFWDNWFIQGQIGASYTFSENSSNGSFGSLISPNAAISLGKYFAPEVGLRAQFGGWEAKTFINNNYYGINYLSANLDALFNLTNIFVPYRENRVFNFIGILGLGGIHGYNNTDLNTGNTNSIVPRVGLAFDFRLSPALNFNIEANGNLISDNFNGIVGDTKYDGTMNVLAGLTYKFKQRGFELVEPMDYELVKSLNDKINQQREEIEKYKTCCEEKQKVTEEPAPVAAPEPAPAKKELNAAVMFRIGQKSIDKNQDITIYKVAQFMNENPDSKVTLTSYSDKKTGTAAYNKKLSKLRSEAIADVLVKKYGISKDRLTLVNMGDTEQPYPDNNDWNRITIFVSE